MVDLPETGSRVRLVTKAVTHEGVLLPTESDTIVLKLDSGYNVGIDPRNVRTVETLAPPAKAEIPTLEVKQDDSLPVIGIVHTGGTIASRVDYKSGGVVADFDPESLLALFPELKELVRIESIFLGNMFSEDFRFAHFNKVASAVHELAGKGVRNIIVTSGTDFLHYHAAALSFLLKDHDVGVLVVGSQRSSDRGSADAGMNLICAAQFLTSTDFNGVGICMHENTNDDKCVILPGVNSRKMHSSRRDAFKAINTTPFATVDYEQKTVSVLRDLPAKRTSIPKGVAKFDEQLKIGLFLTHPQLFAKELLNYEEYDGLVIAGSGFGLLPLNEIDDDTSEHKKIHDALARLAKAIPVVMSTQTISGRVNLNVYATGRNIKKAGVLGDQSAMTPETAFIKLAYLLSTDKDNIAERLMENMLGEHDSEPYEAYDAAQIEPQR